MKNFISKILALSFVLVGFVACSDDDDDLNNLVNGLEDIDIVIDANQTFNMVNFAISFEQMFKADSRWKYGYDHDIVSGNAVVTYKNNVSHGPIGDKVYTYTHNYNTNGVITSSTRVEHDDPYEDENVFTYVYDTEGMIIELTKERNGSIRDIVDLEYNTNKQLVKKIHRGDYNYNDGDEEIFTYNTDGTVSSYWNEAWDSEYVFTYANGNMVKEEYYDGGILENTQLLEYDSSGRLIKEYDEGEHDQWREEYVYYSDYMSEVDYYNNRLDDITDYSEGLVRIKRWDFSYDMAGDLNYCSTKEYYYEEGHDDRLVSKKEYFEGTPENLVLVGYVTVDTRDAANEYKKTKESIYDLDDTLLYYVEYVVSNNSIQSHQLYFPDGTPASDSEITGDLSWIARLISHLD